MLTEEIRRFSDPKLRSKHKRLHFLYKFLSPHVERSNHEICKHVPSSMCQKVLTFSGAKRTEIWTSTISRYLDNGTGVSEAAGISRLQA